MANEQFRRLQKVSCLCGAQIKVDTGSTNHHVVCGTCGNAFDFVVGLDGHKRSQVSIVLSKAAMKTEGDSLGKASPNAPPRAAAPKPAPPPPPPKAPPKETRAPRKSAAKANKSIMALCECGASFPLEETDDLTSLQSCPECKIQYHGVFKVEHGTHEKTAMLVPEKPKHPKSRSTAPKPGMPPPEESRVTDFFTPSSRKGRTKVGNTKARSKAKPPPEIPPGAQGVPCACGTIF